jgi:hypothetical protein
VPFGKLQIHSLLPLRFLAAQHGGVVLQRGVGVIPIAAKVPHRLLPGLAVRIDSLIGQVGVELLLALLPLRIESRSSLAVEGVLRVLPSLLAVVERLAHAEPSWPIIDWFA